MSSCPFPILALAPSYVPVPFEVRKGHLSLKLCRWWALPPPRTESNRPGCASPGLLDSLLWLMLTPFVCSPKSYNLGLTKNFQDWLRSPLGRNCIISEGVLSGSHRGALPQHGNFGVTRTEMWVVCIPGTQLVISLLNANPESVHCMQTFTKQIISCCYINSAFKFKDMFWNKWWRIFSLRSIQWRPTHIFQMHCSNCFLSDVSYTPVVTPWRKNHIGGVRSNEKAATSLYS